MERPGEKLKRVRERLKLTYRDVEKASQQIAARRESDEFVIALSRLADIENKGTVPTMYRLYSLCAIYRLDRAGGDALVWSFTGIITFGVIEYFLERNSHRAFCGRRSCHRAASSRMRD